MIRPIKPEDRETITNWIADDPDHRGRVDAEFFYAPATESLVIEKRGEPVLFYRLSRSLRVDIQFRYDRRLETAAGLVEGCNDLKRRGPAGGFSELIFDSKYEPLMRFATRRLGFWKSPNEFRCRLA